jgi:hypothetical protein
MSVVTIPNMPFGPSAWVSMWQWNAQMPGVLFGPRKSDVTWTRVVNRWPGAIDSVSRV